MSGGKVTGGIKKKIKTSPVRIGKVKDGAYFCYCAHLLRITQGIDRTRRAR